MNSSSPLGTPLSAKSPFLVANGATLFFYSSADFDTEQNTDGFSELFVARIF